MHSPTESRWPATRKPLFLPPAGSGHPAREQARESASSSRGQTSSVNGLLEAWQASRSTLLELGQRLQAADLPEQVVTVAVCGSLGRMEQRSQSDCDLIVLVSRTLDEAECGALQREMAAAIAGLFSRDSTDDGIFSEPVPLSDLLDPARRGLVTEDLPTFGTRMQLLIDSQPVLHPARFAATLRQVLQWYCVDEATTGFIPPWHYLLNDLLRYHRALAIRYQWGWRDDLSRWRLLKVKETHSRLLNIAGLLLLLGDFSMQAAQPAAPTCENLGSLDWLADRLRLTPLERVVRTMGQTAETRAARVLTAAAQLADWLADPAWVQELTTGTGSGLTESPVLETALKTGRQIRSAIGGYLREQQGHWPDEFLDRLVL